MANFWSADWHIDHSLIIDYCHRPFKNTARMSRALIRNYNDVVAEEDLCYFIGDLMMGTDINRLEHILNRMNGTKVLILGNHDRMRPFDYVEAGFQSVHTSLELDILGGIVLAHDPACACAIGDRTLLCGHVHNLFKVQGNAINVGVDVWDFEPVSQRQIAGLLNPPDGKEQ